MPRTLPMNASNPRKPPARNPTRPPATSPNDPRYWDSADLEGELRRTFQVCHECRMCVNYCGTFPSIFAAVDRDVDSGRAEGVEELVAADFERASELCWQCKLCYIKCPYTEDEGASELLDFPRLMAREKANRARRDGVKLVDRILGEPRTIGALGAGPMAPVANLVNANRLVRKATEAATGIAADFPIPELARETFPSWMRKHAPAEAREGELVLFSTCYGDFNVPSVPRAAVAVLEHNGYRVLYPEQTCCGMPNLDGGDIEAARKKIRENVASLLPHVRRGAKIVVPGPTCGYTMKKEWAVYLDTDETREVAAATMDLMEFLDSLRKGKRLDRSFQRGFGKVAYHAACHLRAQKIAYPGMRLLNLLPDTEVRMVEECSAVDGTWGMKAAYYDMGRKYAKSLVEGVEDAEPDLVVSDCSLAGLRMWKENRRRVLHPIEALAQAYGIEPAGAPTAPRRDP